MGGTADLLETVALAAAGEVSRARQIATSMLAIAQDDLGTTRALVGLSFASYLDGDFIDAIVLAERAVAVAEACTGSEARLLAFSMRMFASAGAPWAGEQPDADYFAIAWAMRGDLADLDADSRMIAAHLLAEGALATGRLSEAQEVLDELDEFAGHHARSPVPAFFTIQRARVMLFRGELAQALPVAREAIRHSRAQGSDISAALCEAFIALIQANLNDRPSARQSLATLALSDLEPRGLLATGVWIVCAYSYFAVGDRVRAAECVLVAGGGPELRKVQVVDRALGYEILVADALDRDDLEAAARWGERSMALAAHPAASVIVEQLLARLDDARGLSTSAAERAGVSAARARLTGRYLDAARTDLIRARALAAAGLQDTAVRELIGFAHSANRDGLYSYGRAAATELRRLGRRLPPETGAGWSALSERERQIAVLAAEGFSNRVIADTLFLSDRTVQSHLTRVLTALDLSSRSALPARVGGRFGRPQDDLPDLTPRQWAVARHIAQGDSNRAIGEALAISVKTVEKHVGEILSRWGLTSRTGIASVLAAEEARTA